MLVFDCFLVFGFTRVKILSKYYEHIHVICVLYLVIPLNLQYLTFRIFVFDCFLVLFFGDKTLYANQHALGFCRDLGGRV